MHFMDIIAKKRDGEILSAAEIDEFVNGLADGSLPREQAAALAMAIFIRSMNAEETGALTLAMAHSGTVLDWHEEDIDRPIVDKHSTGGIGDKVSLVLAPIAAACGCAVPMISGRGLAHSGGTLDKLDSIPGYTSTPTLNVFRKTVKAAGCAIVGQTDDLAPADRTLYAIRDITATVASIPLITASILSKKIAAGLQGLVMDIKVGTGAFMSTLEEARTLGQTIVDGAAAAGLTTNALITDMSQTLGHTAGNAVEVHEAIEFLTGGHRDTRLNEVILALSAEMLILAGLEHDHGSAKLRAEKALSSGAAAEAFARMVSSLGGPSDLLERARAYLPTAPVIKPAYTSDRGYLTAVDGRAIGNAIISLGGGRRRADDTPDLSVGFSEVAPIGAYIGPDRPLALVHAATEDMAARAILDLHTACTLSATPGTAGSVIYERLTGR